MLAVHIQLEAVHLQEHFGHHEARPSVALHKWTVNRHRDPVGGCLAPKRSIDGLAKPGFLRSHRSAFQQAIISNQGVPPELVRQGLMYVHYLLG